MLRELFLTRRTEQPAAQLHTNEISHSLSELCNMIRPSISIRSRTNGSASAPRTGGNRQHEAMESKSNTDSRILGKVDSCGPIPESALICEQLLRGFAMSVPGWRRSS